MTKKDTQPTLRIKLKSYDSRMLDASLTKILGLLTKSGADIRGPIPLPKKRKLYTTLKSNFVYKDAREQFERITYSRLIDVVETGPKTMEYLQNLSIPVGVLVDIKVF
jgi:small subunit ribosomal protein S10